MNASLFAWMRPFLRPYRGRLGALGGLLFLEVVLGALQPWPLAFVLDYVLSGRPLPGFLADRIGPGKIVLTGITVITVGMAMFTQIGADTSYAYILGALFIMGLGMGGTMMPIMTAALATLTAHNVARGSTLLNITQQVAASIGTALFSVILTNEIKDSKFASAGAALAHAGDDPSTVAAIMEKFGLSPNSIKTRARRENWKEEA